MRSNPKPVKEMAEDVLAMDGQGGVQVALGGDIIHWSTAETGGAGELFGILVAAIVLFLTLGVVAMGLPLLNALFAMVVSLSLMGILGTRVLDVVDWTPQLAAMIGIGVGIDYALLILNRFRLERGAGRDVREATLVSLDTSGRAVLFAGIVVVIAMLGMLLLGISFLYGPAIGAALSVAGDDVGVAHADAGDPRHPDRPSDQEVQGAQRGRGERVRRPLGALRLAPARAGRDPRAGRAARARLARDAHAARDQRCVSTYKSDDTARIAYDLLKEGFGAGFNAPLLLAVELPQAGDQAPLEKISAALSGQDGIAQVLPPILNEAGDTATMIAYPTTTPQDEQHRRDGQDGA